MAHKFLSYLSSPATSALFRRRKSAAPATSALFRRRKSAAPATSALFRRISAAPATSALFRHKSAAPAISDIIQRKSKSAPPTSSVFGRRATDTASRSRSIGYRRIEVHLNFWSLPASLRSAVYSRIGLDLNLWNNLASSRLADNIGSNYRYYGGGRFTHGRHMKGGRKSRTRKQKKPASDPPTHTCPVCLDKFHTSAALRQHQRAKNHYSGPINETNNTENVVKSEVRNETSGFVSTEVPEKINETKDVMKRKANEIDKSKIEKSRGEKGGYMSLQSMGSRRIDSGFGSDTSTAIHGSGGLGIGPGFGLNSEVESFSSKPKGRPPASAAAPSKGGMQLGKIQRTNQFLESLKAEGEVIVEDVRPSVGQSSVAAPPPTDPVTLTVDEKLNVTLKQDGGIGSFDLQGTLSLQILNQDDGHIQVQIESGGNPGIIFKTHPNINKDLFSGKNILGSKDPNRPFPANQTGDGLPVLKWRMQSSDESLVPLSINCWPSVSGNETYVNLEYEASPKFGLQNVVISIPLPALREAPKVQQIDGEWRYDSRKSILEWSIVLIDNSNISGFMEFVIPAIDTSDLFPISVRFSSTSTFSGLKVANIVPLKGGNAPKFSQRTLLSTDNYQVA